MMRVRINYIYFRYGHLEFLKAIMKHPRVKFAFYSMIPKSNLFPIIDKIFENDEDLLRNKGLFDRDFNKKAPEVTGNDYKFIADLDKVWESHRC